MSTYWHLECVEELWGYDASINHGEKELLDLLELFRSGKIPTTETWPHPAIELRVELWGNDAHWDFLLEHNKPECDVRVVSEYRDEFRRNPETGEPEIIRGGMK